MAFAVYGMAVVLAPALGTHARWMDHRQFHLALDFLYQCARGNSLFIHDQSGGRRPAYLQREQARRRSIPGDYIGLGLLTTAIASLQIVLDKGQESDWFGTWWITALTIAAAYAFIVWIVWEWYHPNPVVDIRLFQRRNFATAMFFSFMLGIVLLGTTFMLPQLLQIQLHYTAVRAGEALAGGGFVMICMLPIVGMLVTRVTRGL